MRTEPITQPGAAIPVDVQPASWLTSGWSSFKNIGINSSWLFLARLITQGQLAFFSIWVARQLGASGFGQYSIIASVVFLGNVLTTFGTDTLLIRDLARTRRGDDPSISTAIGLQVWLSIVFILCVSIWVRFFPTGTPDTRAGLVIYSFSLLPLAFFSVFTAVLRAWERMDLFLLLSIVTALLQAGGALWVVRGSGSLPALIWFLLLVQVVATVIAGFFCWRVVPNFRLKVTFNLKWLAGLVRLAWPLALLSLFGVVYQRVGVLAVSFYGGDAQTGWFSAASRLVEGFKLLHIAVLGALLPALSNRGNQPQEAGKLFKIAFFCLGGISLTTASFGTLLAGPMVTFLFGMGYTQTVPIFRLLVWVLVPYSLTACLSLRLITRGKERSALAAMAGGLALALGFNLWLVQAHGSVGAAIAAVLSECILAVIFLWLKG
jgi:O-antigen/teichoic acid export membrane protein